MSDFRPNDPLLMAGKILTIIMQAAMAIAALGLIIAIPLVLFFQGEIAAKAAEEFAGSTIAFPLMAVMGLLVLALIMVGMIFVFFDRLRRIIGTVGEGDPFAPINADRLSMMAWLLLAVQVVMVPLAGLGLFIAKWADQFEHTNVTIDAGFDLSGILMVLVLFILARVFRQGAAMREDLEGTV